MKKTDFPGVTGHRMRTVTGGYVDFANPQADQFNLTDISVGLGSECRFGNQLDEHYSVAEHCLVCLAIIADQFPDYSIELKRAVLMHDAAEAFCKDIPKPLKIMLPNYKKIEDRFQGVIDAKYGTDYGGPVVKAIDLMALKAEKRAFGNLVVEDKQHDLSSVPDVSVVFNCFDRHEAARWFGNALHELGIVEPS